jgi:hypothetical protein
VHPLPGLWVVGEAEFNTQAVVGWGLNFEPTLKQSCYARPCTRPCSEILPERGDRLVDEGRRDDCTDFGCIFGQIGADLDVHGGMLGRFDRRPEPRMYLPLSLG